MEIDYPLPIWRNADLTLREDTSSSAKLSFSRLPKSAMKKNEGEPSTAYLFVLFIKLPSWESNDSYENFSKIRTLRNLKNGIEVYQVKAALELSTGFPAHISTLVTSTNERLTDGTKLIIGQNVVSGSSFKLEIIDAWQDIVKAAWTGNLSELRLNLPDSEKEDAESSTAFKEFASAIQKSGKERAFCGLFAAAVRGHLPICKAILKEGFDPNLTTFFGNTALHAAANNGQFEVIQLLITYDANIRAINAEKKSALDIAANCGFIDCARWLWLNQWSTGSSKSKPDLNTSGREGNLKQGEKQSRKEYSPAKPLRECTTLFTKPPQIRLPSMDSHLKGSSASPILKKQENVGRRTITERPKSSPLSWKIDESGKNITFSKSDQIVGRSSRIKSASMAQNRPITAFSKKNLKDVSMQSIPIPQIPAQVAASLRRSRSIPSVKETRFQSYKIAHLKVDLSSNSVVKPLTIDMTLDNRWINPKSFSELFSTSLDHLKSSETLRSDSEKLSKSYSFLSTLNNSNYAEEVENNEATKPTRHSAPTISTSSLHEEKTKTKQVNDQSDCSVVETQNVLLKNNLNRTHQKSILKQTFEDKTEEISHENAISPATIKAEFRGPNAKSSSNIVDSYDSLHGNEKNSKIDVKQTKQLRFDMSKIKDQPKKNPEFFHPDPTPVPPKKLTSSQSFPPVAKENQHDQSHHSNRKKMSVDENQTASNLSRLELLRKERSKTAWSEWKAAKQKEKAIQKMKKKEEIKKQNDHVILTYGITFDQWLAGKKKEAEKKQATEFSFPSKSEVDPPTKYPKRSPNMFSNGKTFEKWLKEKKEEKPKEFDNSKMSEKEAERLNKMRQLNFANWSARKLEEAKKEKRKKEQEEQDKKKSLNKMHDMWMSKDRVMPFEAWKKRKEIERKKIEKEEAEQMEKEYVNAWAAEKRKKQAEKEFKKWVNKKNLVMLEKTTEELKEAKQEREEVEKKLKVRRALLHAKILMRWQRMSRRSSKSKKKRLNSDAASLSLSTGDITDFSTTDDVALRDLKALSENEDDVFRNNDAFKNAVARLRSQRKPKRSSKPLSAVDEKDDKANDDDALESKKVHDHSSGSSTSSSSESGADEKILKLKEKSKPKIKRKKKKNQKKNNSLSNFTPLTTNSPVQASNPTIHLHSPTSKDEVKKESAEENDKTKKPKKVTVLNQRKPNETFKRSKPRLGSSSSPYATSVSYTQVGKKTKKKNSQFTLKNSEVVGTKKPSRNEAGVFQETDLTQTSPNKNNLAPEKSDKSNGPGDLMADQDVSEKESIFDVAKNEALISEVEKSDVPLGKSKTFDTSDNVKKPEVVFEGSEQNNLKISGTNSNNQSKPKSNVQESNKLGFEKILNEKTLSIDPRLSNFASRQKSVHKSKTNFIQKSQANIEETGKIIDVGRKNFSENLKEIYSDNENHKEISSKSSPEKSLKVTYEMSLELSKTVTTKSTPDNKTNRKLPPKTLNTNDKNLTSSSYSNQKLNGFTKDTNIWHEKHSKDILITSRPPSSSRPKSYKNNERNSLNSSKNLVSEAESSRPFGFTEELLLSGDSSIPPRRQITISMPSASQIIDDDIDAPAQSD